MDELAVMLWNAAACSQSQVTSQKRKKSRIVERTTCRAKGNPGPVNRMSPVQAQRMMNARAMRVRCFNTEGT